MKPIILLTGSSGFMGSHIKKNLDTTNLHYFTLGRSRSDIICDLKKSIPENLQNFDIIIHAAGKAHNIPKTLIEKNDFFEVNVDGTSNLLRGLEKSNIIPKKFLYISSVSVYGKESGLNISENEPLLAKDPYGLSKIEAEELVTNWCKEKNVVCTILRLPLVVGQNPPGNLSSMINGIRKGFYFNLDGGAAKKSMVLATDVAKFILKAAEVGGTYNLTDGYHPNFNELSHYIARQNGKKFVPDMPMYIAKLLAFVGDRFGLNFPINSNKLLKITSSLTFDDSKGRKAFGWNPTPVLKGFTINE